jgi:hypothetical protein
MMCSVLSSASVVVVLVVVVIAPWSLFCVCDGLTMDGWTDGRLHSSPVEKQKSVDKNQTSNKKTKCNILCVYVNANAVVMSSSLSALMQLD